MEMSLDQAIEIHAKVLKRRSGRLAANKAREIAQHFALVGDHEGYRVWLRVGEVADSLTQESARN
jgi:hypothetical protein